MKASNLPAAGSLGKTRVVPPGMLGTTVGRTTVTPGVGVYLARFHKYTKPARISSGMIHIQARERRAGSRTSLIESGGGGVPGMVGGVIGAAPLHNVATPGGISSRALSPSLANTRPRAAGLIRSSRTSFPSADIIRGAAMPIKRDIVPGCTPQNFATASKTED